MNDWRLCASVAEGRPHLMDPRHSFESIVASLSLLHTVDAGWDWGRNGPLLGHARAYFEIVVDSRAYDLFFNGRDGYRARYYRSVEAGIQANVDLLAALRASLSADASRFGLDVDWPVSEVQRGLRSAGAKVWISESELDAREPNWQPAEIEDIRDEVLVSRWVSGIRTYAERAASRGGYMKNAILAGTRAFTGSRLRVFGGFIVPGRPEAGSVIPLGKEHRSLELHDYGFS